MKTTTIYNRAFWNAMRGKKGAYNEMHEGEDSDGYTVPVDFQII